MARNALFLALATATALALAAPAVHAQHYVILETPGDPGNCGISYAPFSQVSVAVVHYTDATGGATQVAFSAPVPACLPGTVWLFDTFVGAQGDSQTGIVVPYGGCLEGPILVGTIKMFVSSAPTECCAMQVLPHPNAASGMVEALDCSGQVRTESGLAGVFSPPGEVCAGVGPSHSPDPPDGATQVPLDATLSWEMGLTLNPCGGLTEVTPIVMMGTDPGALYEVARDVSPPFDPGALQGGVTYYWRIDHEFLGRHAGPVWEFTTALVVPAESSTWGRVKALYH
jgi:hypothetical protein